MKVHILAGDCLANQFPKSILGEKIICRECLIEVDLSGETLADFWQARAKFIEADYSESDYFEKVVKEFEKLDKLEANAEINLWFEYELFCQVNLWFVIYLLQLKGLVNVCRVLPVIKNQAEVWKGFGNLSEIDLENSYKSKVKLNEKDIETGAKLWLAYQANDLKILEELSNYQSPVFPYLSEVCQAETERKLNNKVEESLQIIINNDTDDFAEVFREFQKSQGVYGFGDTQVKKIYERLLQK